MDETSNIIQLLPASAEVSSSRQLFGGDYDDDDNDDYDKVSREDIGCGKVCSSTMAATTHTEQQRQPELPGAGASSMMLASLLSSKDVKLEHFLQDVMEEFMNGCQQQQQSNTYAAAASSTSLAPQPHSVLEDYSNSTFEEREQAFATRIGDRISGVSSILWHRVGPIAQALVNKRLKDSLESQIAVIVQSVPPLLNYVDNYRKLFFAFFDTPFLSFQTGNWGALHNISPKDYWILQYFALSTSKRVRGDSCLQVGLAGDTSIGKSTLFEAPLTNSSHFYLASAGVGRFRLDSKPVLFFNDVDISDLCLGKDRDLLKTVARGEPTQSKVHSSTICIPPVHLIYTSNTRLFSHLVPVAPASQRKRKWTTAQGPLVSPPPLAMMTHQEECNSKKRKLTKEQKLKQTPKQNYQLQIPQLFGLVNPRMTIVNNSCSREKDQVSVTTAAAPSTNMPKTCSTHPSDLKMNSANTAHIRAVQARFLECYCARKPQLDKSLFPTYGMFQKLHMVFGMYLHILELMETRYSPSDFYSRGLPLYVLSGLAKHAKKYEEKVSDQHNVTQRIIGLAQKFFPPQPPYLNVAEHNSILDHLFNTTN